MKIYFSHTIRGLRGNECHPEIQKENIKKACQRAYVLQEHFPEHEWVVPHANEIVNRLYFNGLVGGDAIVDVECELIQEDGIDGVVVVGEYGQQTGVAREAIAAYNAGKFVWFIDDVDELGRMSLASGIAEWISD